MPMPPQAKRAATMGKLGMEGSVLALSLIHI